ncbi:MAG: hypothetical protein ACI4L8_08410 [Candidatus Fimadaptatus sp.]
MSMANIGIGEGDAKRRLPRKLIHPGLDIPVDRTRILRRIRFAKDRMSGHPISRIQHPFAKYYALIAFRNSTMRKPVHSAIECASA